MNPTTRLERGHVGLLPESKGVKALLNALIAIIKMNSKLSVI